MAIDIETLAYLKYEGTLISEGYLDLKKSADVLYGLDKSLRYFLYQENQDIQEIEFDIPVRIKKGSWEALIPDSIEKIIIAASLFSAGAYSKKALEKMAERDFEKIGFKDLFKKAFKALVWVIKIAKHLRTMNKRDFKEIKFADDNKTALVTNEEGKTLAVPIEYLERYVACPENLLSQITKIIETERELEIGVNDQNEIDENKSVRITILEKEIFFKEEENEDILFPELKDGDYVEIEGHVTRGNENSNTIGFFYNGHVLTCYPSKGNVNEHKMKIFSNCKIKGYVDRTSKEGKLIEKRPRIRFIELILLDRPLPNLFSQ
jgi:hypothetical protein